MPDNVQSANKKEVLPMPQSWVQEKVKRNQARLRAHGFHGCAGCRESGTPGSVVVTLHNPPRKGHPAPPPTVRCKYVPGQELTAMEIPEKCELAQQRAEAAKRRFQRKRGYRGYRSQEQDAAMERILHPQPS